MKKHEPLSSSVQLADRLIGIREVEHITGLKKSSVYALMRNGKFPRAVHLTGRCSRWPHSRIQQFVQERIAEADALAEVERS